MITSLFADLLNQLSFGKFVVAISLLLGGAALAYAMTLQQQATPTTAASTGQIGSGNGNQGHTVINNCNSCTIVTPNKLGKATNKE